MAVKKVGWGNICSERKVYKIEKYAKPCFSLNFDDVFNFFFAQNSGNSRNKEVADKIFQ